MLAFLYILTPRMIPFKRKHCKICFLIVSLLRV